MTRNGRKMVIFDVTIRLGESDFIFIRMTVFHMM